MNISFQDKRILVTGAGQGIGRDLAKRLVKFGATVVAVSKTKENVDSLIKEVPGIIGLAQDITKWEETRDLVQAHGPYDCLVNNAGLAILEPFLTASQQSFDKLFDVNVKAVFNISQVVANGMVKNGIKGSIVNVSSQASQAAVKDHALYCSTKGGLDMLSKVMALELGEHGIRVNCVNPTVVLTRMGRIGWEDPSKAGPMLEKIPLHRFADVDEVVDTICYLLSDKSSMVNGITLPIDGGFLAC